MYDVSPLASHRYKQSITGLSNAWPAPDGALQALAEVPWRRGSCRQCRGRTPGRGGAETFMLAFLD
ncbi:hypothetical protein AWT69_001991 [Pseudomonas putida]|nr:hypothetical protein AWT69_001991 [Pseudomonas putida]